METAKVIQIAGGLAAYLKKYAPWMESSIREHEAVAEGRLISDGDDRWSKDKAFPIIDCLDIDGWEFILRGHDEKYKSPITGRPSLVEARLVNFTRGRAHISHEGKCLECGAYADAGQAEFVTPSGRKFYAGYRSNCGCREGGPDVSQVAAPRLEHDKAIEVFVSYFAKSEEENKTLKAVARAWYDKKPGSMGGMKAAVRQLGIAN